MKSLLNASILCLMLAASAVGLSATTQYAEALRCHSRYSDAFGPEAAGTLCRGVQSSNATALFQCVDLASDRDLSLPAIAEICQGATYAALTATMNCLDQALETMDQMPAARLCQKVRYDIYTTRFNCVSAVADLLDQTAAAELCGGVE